MNPTARIIAIAMAAIVLGALVVSPAIGGPSLQKIVKKAVKKEVNKQIDDAEGPKGAAGAPGSPGSPGAPATALFAGVNSDGTLSAQSGVVGTVSHTAASGSYTITFNRNVDPCVPVASLSNDDPGQILASVLGGANNTVSVFTQDNAGAIADGAFGVAVFC